MNAKTFAFALAAILSTGCTTVRQLRDHSTLTPNGIPERTRAEKALDYSVAIKIDAPPEAVWAVLTNADGYTKWNSTLVSMKGKIALNDKVELISKDAPDRTFNLAVTSFEPNKVMVWEDGGSMFLGVRTFTLIPVEGGTVFAMSETYSGGMLGMIEGSLPDFTKSFAAYAADLKKVVETPAAK